MVAWQPAFRQRLLLVTKSSSGQAVGDSDLLEAQPPPSVSFTNRFYPSMYSHCRAAVPPSLAAPRPEQHCFKASGDVGWLTRNGH